MMILTVTTLGASEVCILDNEAKLRLNVKPGDTLLLTEAPDGALRITPYDPDLARQMALAETILHEDHSILRKLS